jgi:hypothetical protein
MDENRLRDLGKGLRALIEGFTEGPSPSRTDGDGSATGFPDAGIDGFLSHFVFTVRINRGAQAGAVFSYTWPAAIQTVARSKPFIHPGDTEKCTAEFPLPNESALPRKMSGADFLATPPGFFEAGKETIFLQILNLDARGQTPFGPMRCILGETFRKEYKDIFRPSFGAAQSLGKTGLPAKLFFVPNGIFETPFGALHTRPKALLGARIEKVPPVGSSPELLEPIPLDLVDDLRANPKEPPEPPLATLIALAHPIDALLHGPDLFQTVERAIGQ